jgi:thioredoxin-like negative regulator of GroEL
MEPLPSQEFFEGLLVRDPAQTAQQPMVVVRFGASWCGPCKRVDTQALLDFHPGIKWYYADIDEGENTYTLGYAGCQQIPSFIAIRDGKPQPPLQSSDTQKIIAWLKTSFQL